MEAGGRSALYEKAECAAVVLEGRQRAGASGVYEEAASGDDRQDQGFEHVLA